MVMILTIVWLISKIRNPLKYKGASPFLGLSPSYSYTYATANTYFYVFYFCIGGGVCTPRHVL